MEGNRARLRGWDAFVATGVMYQNSNDVSKDYAAAMEWYRRGAKLLNADAQLNIGPLYRSGLGVQQDYCTAMAWYLKAAEQGLVDAQVEVASLYRYGHGDQDDVQVIRLASKNRTVHVATHHDPSSGKIIVLWNDVLRVFPGALYLQQGKKALPFLKGTDFEDLRPLRIAAILGVTLDIVVQEGSISGGEPPRQDSARPTVAISSVNSTVLRNPVYGDELAALENYNHIDIPYTSARGPQFIPDDPIFSRHVSSDRRQEPPASVKSGPHAPQFHPVLTPTLPVKSSQRENSIAELAQLGGRIKRIERSSYVPSSNVSKQDAAAEYSGHAEFQRGVQHETGIGGARVDYGLAMECYLKAAKQGHIEASYNIAQLHEYGRGVPKDEAKAAEWYIKAGEKGYIPAQINLAYRYAFGKGVPLSYLDAFNWRLLAAEQGDASAQYMVGHQYSSGNGVRKDDLKALEWYLKAAKQGDAQAQYNAGEIYSKGSPGVPQDYPKALDWYLKAAENGHVMSQYHLGLLYKNGFSGFQKDFSKALEWLLKAANRNHSNAEYEVGDIYRLGLGVPVDESKAMEWYIRAADQGHYNARKSHDDLSAKIRGRQQQQHIAGTT
ncbi:hypothetical protein BGZ97_003502 [Linnemannia gamsii]|uniref:HCP-like protein n=1 Tax=Linnemannia gamsii TaxID=64522 RepID=A0A9P6QUF2_9FUNG|nr:hypothetical protein BGZ97_003502 [Linnemannia gamsii]